MTGPEVTQPDPDGGVEMTDGEWAAFRGYDVPEVTAAMKAEDVDPALVEKAARAAYEIDEHSVGTLDLHPWSDVIEGHREVWRVMARHALAAVLPEIQAQALLDFAGPEGGDLEPHEFRDAANWGAWKARQAARYEAARLTATTEGLTTCLPSLGEPCGSCHRCTETQGDGRG